MYVDCIQIGAHVGKGDRVYRAAEEGGLRSGLFLEPLPHLFEELRQNYAALPGDFRCLNMALHPKKRSAVMHYVAEVEGLPLWACAVGSMVRATRRKHRVMMREECGRAGRFKRIRVPCVSFRQLFAEHRLQGVDELHVDAEGMDGMIVRSFPFDRTLPRKVVFEHVHLQPDDLEETLHLLRSLGYGFRGEGLDVIAVR